MPVRAEESSRRPAIDTAAAVAAARAVQPAWAERPARSRLAPVRALRRAIGDDPSRFVDALAGLGRPTEAESLSAEIVPLADACRFLEREAVRILAPRRLGRRGRPGWLPGVRAEVRREPIGVVLVIGPSNYPLLLPGVQAIQALAAGNAVLLKPGRGGAGAAGALASALTDGGLDPRLLGVLDEAAEAATVAIDAGVDKVVLTGSATTGEAVARRLAPLLVPSVMELSGCDAVFVRDDADPDRVARALAFGARLNGGATCIAPRRVFVARRLARDLEKRLGEAVSTVPPRRVDPEAATRAIALVREALDRGARLVTGDVDAGSDMSPIVVADASPDMDLLRSDIFAPVLALVAVSGDDEALDAAARCPYALGASIFGEPTGARALAARVRAGSVTINDIIVPTADPRLPFGGRGRSGFGTTRGREGLLEMTVPKSVSERTGRFLHHLDPPLHDDGRLFATWLAAAHGSGAVQRARAVVDLTRALAGRIVTGAARRSEGGR